VNIVAIDSCHGLGSVWTLVHHAELGRRGLAAAPERHRDDSEVQLMGKDSSGTGGGTSIDNGLQSIKTRQYSITVVHL